MNQQCALLSYSGKPTYFAHFVPDLGIAYLAAAIKSCGYECTYFDLNLPNATEEEVLSYVVRERPPFIGMKIWGNGFRELCALARKIREIDKDVVIVAGGPQITMYRETVLRVTDAFDFLIYGEGEQAIVEFIEYVEGKRAVEDVRNLIYSQNGVIIRTPSKLSQDLDLLPIPDWSIFQLQNYLPLFMMNFQRGCPFACSFCSHNYFWGRTTEDSELLGTDMTFIRQHGSIRKRTWPHIEREIEKVVNSYNVRLIEIVDSTPNISLLASFADYIIKNTLPIKWTAFARVNQYTERLYEKFAKAGCVALWYGIEAGNESMRRRMGKTFSNQAVYRSIALAKRYGIKTICAVIAGFPGESMETLEESLALLEGLHPDTGVVIPFQLQPGSPIAFSPKRYGVMLHDNWMTHLLVPWQEKEPQQVEYYDIDGVPNTEYWKRFEEKSTYKNWVEKRELTEAEIAYLLGEHFQVDGRSAANAIQTLLSQGDTTGLQSMISDAWDISRKSLARAQIPV